MIVSLRVHQISVVVIGGVTSIVVQSPAENKSDLRRKKCCNNLKMNAVIVLAF